MLKNAAIFVHRLGRGFAGKLHLLFPEKRGRPLHYLFAIVLMGVALLARMAIASVESGLQYLTFFPAVALSVIIGGIGPGLLAMVMGLALATYIFTPPYYSISFEVLETSFWSNLVFLIDGVIVCFSIEAMHRFRQNYAAELKQANTARTLLEESEGKLRRQNDLLESVYGNTLDAVLQMNSAGIITGWNRQAELIFGWGKKEAIGQLMSELIMPERYRESYMAGLKHYLLTGQGPYLNKRIEINALNRNGRELSIDMSISPVMTPDGYEFFAFVRDITERKKMLTDLHGSERHLRQAQFIAHIGSWDIDIATSQMTWSDELFRILGVSPETFTPCIENLVNLTHPEDQRPLREWIQQYKSGKKPGAIEFRCVRPDGSVCYINGRCELLFDDDGKPYHISGTAQDITRRKKAEDEWRAAAVAFETHEAIMITDAQANIVRVNQAFSRITGYSANEVLGKSPSMMKSEQQDKSFYTRMWQELLHTGMWEGEIWDTRKNGQVYPKWLTITAVKNEHQETTHYVALFSDITARKQAEDEIHKLAFYDALTKLPNRRLFLDRFEVALIASERRHDFGAVLFIDLDRFKALNDSLGHEHGDLLLIEVGVRIKSCVREMDTVARYGGDEFVVLIEAISNDRDDATLKVAQVAEKIREALTRPYQLKKYEHHSSPSIGICLFHGNKESMDTLIEHADMAMYQAKNLGRNAVHFFDPVMQQNVSMHDALVNDLHHAIGLQQLHLYYQIQVDNESRPTGAEAFLRWMHPEHGTLLPGQFLPLARESALIIDIDLWVLNTACRQLALWGRSERTSNLALTINISDVSFAQPDFVDKVSGILKEHNANPALLKLELSERLVLTDLHGALEKIRALRKIGVRLSVDNFNTVYSSLSYLKQLSSDQLKIHQEFVRGIVSEGNDAQLAQAMINLAKSLGLDVVAEGVENERQRDFLMVSDCNLYQGFLFGKPMPIEEFEEVLNCGTG